MRWVVHCKQSPYDIYIGRPSKWGNMYSHKEGTKAKYKVDTVEEAIQAYADFINSSPEFIAEIKRELKGKILGCWCKTKRSPDAPCHGDVLAEIANE